VADRAGPELVAAGPVADLAVDDLTFTYPGAPSPALSGVTLTITAGEFLLIAGPSGCGKSTLALALAGLVPGRVRGHLSGTVHLAGVPLASQEPQQVAQQVGIVFQDPSSQLVTPTVEAEVAFGPENLALPREQIRRRVEDALAATGTARLRSATTASLSGGEKQRVAIAATLAMRPRVLVLDEPCSDLDPRGAQDVLRVLRTLNRDQQMTVVLVEHRIDEVVPWVDRVLLLDRGRVVLDSPTRAAFTDPDCWDDLGVAVPEMVRLARALPRYFPGPVPLSVEDAHHALGGSPAAAALTAAAFSSRPPAQPRRCTDPEPVAEAAPGAPVLSWAGVSIRYDDRRVLDGVDLAVHRGEWLAVAGPNGSGKTSLMELAMGFRRPTTGTVTLNGSPVNPSDVSRQARQVGYLFQSADTMLFTASVRKELQFGRQHRRRTRRGGRSAPGADRTGELLDLTGLTDRADADPFALSAGQRERLAIAALLVDVPQVLILDEPTTGQDEAHARAILTFLDGLRRATGLTYVMVTHDMRVVARYATRLAVLAGGRIIADGPPAEVFAHRDHLTAAQLVAPPVADLHSRLVPTGLTRVSLTVDELVGGLDPGLATHRAAVTAAAGPARGLAGAVRRTLISP